MRIGIDVRALMDKRYSGVSEYVFNLLEAILAQDKKNDYVLFYNSGRDITAKMPNFSAKNASYLRTAYPNKLFNYFLEKLLKYPRLDKVCDSDVFFMPHINFASFASPASSIICIHDLSYLYYPNYFSWRKNVWHRAINTKKILKSFGTVVALSKNGKDDILEQCSDVLEEKVFLIPSGIAKEFREIDKKNSKLEETRQRYNLPEKFILYLGTIEPRKNVGGLISAYEMLLEENPSFTHDLVIAGARGWKYKKTIKHWEHSRYNNRIHFIGYVDKRDKAYLYNLADIFVYPSFYEGFGFPPLEAMGCGVPTIASATSSLGEVLSSAAILINPHEPRTIAIAIKELINNSELKELMKQKGKKQAAKYSWEMTARKYINLFETLGRADSEQG